MGDECSDCDREMLSRLVMGVTGDVSYKDGRVRDGSKGATGIWLMHL